MGTRSVFGFLHASAHICFTLGCQFSIQRKVALPGLASPQGTGADDARQLLKSAMWSLARGFRSSASLKMHTSIRGAFGMSAPYV
jgi:hypothetical protein